jgi:uncharacterized membrane protein YkgB
MNKPMMMNKQTTQSMEPAILVPLFALIQRMAAPSLRMSLGIILLWIGALKFIDPSPVVGLLDASLPFLAFAGFVYVLGVFEIIAAIWLFTNRYLRYVGLLVMGLFAGTLLIFLITPAVTGLPFLTLVGQFLLKDAVLFAAAMTIIARDMKGE